MEAARGCGPAATRRAGRGTIGRTAGAPSLPIQYAAMERNGALDFLRIAATVEVVAFHCLGPVRREQYLFNPADFDDLGGSRLRTVRRNVSAIEKLPNVELRPYRPEDAEACYRLLDAWTAEHRERHGTSGGRSSARRMIRLAGALPETVLRGQVILIDGELVGYGFGGAIHSQLGCFHEAKCKSDIKGLTYYQRRSFLSSLRDYPLVNDGSDVGRQGLRQIKQSFRPTGMHREHRGYQHG